VLFFLRLKQTCHGRMTFNPQGRLKIPHTPSHLKLPVNPDNYGLSGYRQPAALAAGTGIIIHMLQPVGCTLTCHFH
jgi:hypothetical protein